MTTFDVLNISIVFLCSLFGFRRGIYIELFKIITLILSLLVGIKFILPIAVTLIQLIGYPLLSTLLALCGTVALLMGAMRVFFLGGFFYLFKRPIPKLYNKRIGAGIGAIRGYIWASMLLYVFSVSHSIRNQEEIARSITYIPISKLYHILYNNRNSIELSSYISFFKLNDKEKGLNRAPAEGFGLFGRKADTLINSIKLKIKYDLPDRSTKYMDRMLNRLSVENLEQIEKTISGSDFNNKQILPFISSVYHKQLNKGSIFIEDGDQAMINNIATDFLLQFNFVATTNSKLKTTKPLVNQQMETKAMDPKEKISSPKANKENIDKAPQSEPNISKNTKQSDQIATNNKTEERNFSPSAQTNEMRRTPEVISALESDSAKIPATGGVSKSGPDKPPVVTDLASPTAGAASNKHILDDLIQEGESILLPNEEIQKQSPSNINSTIAHEAKITPNTNATKDGASTNMATNVTNKAPLPIKEPNDTEPKQEPSKPKEIINQNDPKSDNN